MDNKVQVLLYTRYLHIIGGIETFVDNFISLMGEFYDIGIYCPQMPPERMLKLSQKVPVFTTSDTISCHTLIMIRIMDDIPENITYKHSIRMCHATKSNPSWFIKPGCEKTIHVSKASKKSFDSDGFVIYNPVIKSDRKSLLLVSATRVPAMDKGDNAKRMLELAKILNSNHIPFLWLNFSDAPLKNAPKGFINVGTYGNIQPYIEKADYVVQLSDYEGFGYSIAEALNCNTAVICTPFETTKELGVVDGQNGYIIPFDVKTWNKFDVKKLLNIPKFEYKYDNDKIANQWKKEIGKLTPTHKYKPPKNDLVRVKASYRDVLLGRDLLPGEVLEMSKDRIKAILAVGDLIEVIKGD